MLKDCIPTNDAASEEEFVGDFCDARWAQAVDDLPARWRKILGHPYYRLLKKIIARKSGARVLDCGCGMGEWTLQLHDEGIETADS